MINSTTVDMLQGRVSPSILTRHYLVPESSLRQKVLQSMVKLKAELEV